MFGRGQARTNIEQTPSIELLPAFAQGLSYLLLNSPRFTAALQIGYYCFSSLTQLVSGWVISFQGRHSVFLTRLREAVVRTESGSSS
jgi:hypothetical protein